MAFNLGQRIRVSSKHADIDERKGPFNSITEALNANSPTSREKGRTVYIIENGKVVEYWFEAGTADSDLVKKTQGGSGDLTPVFKTATMTDIGASESETQDDIDQKFATWIESQGFVIPQGEIWFFELLREGSDPDESSSNLTLEQVRQNSNVVEGNIVGNEEFDKQGDRKAFAQMSDVYDNAVGEITYTDTIKNTTSTIKVGQDQDIDENNLTLQGEFIKLQGGDDDVYNKNTTDLTTKKVLVQDYNDGKLYTYEGSLVGDIIFENARLKKADVAPAEGWKDGIYFLVEDGTYSNLTPPLTAVPNKMNIGTVKNGVWELKVVDVVNPSVINGFASNSSIDSGSAKNDKLLYSAIKKLRFDDGIDIVVPSTDYEYTIDYKTLQSYTNNGSVVTQQANLTPQEFTTRAMVFTGDKADVTFDAGYGDEFIIFCKAIQNATQMCAVYMKTGKTTLTRIIFDVTGTYNLGDTPTLFPIDRTKTISFDYTDDLYIKVYQDGALICQFTKASSYYDKPALGIVGHDNLTKKYTYALYGTTPTIPEQPDVIVTEEVLIGEGNVSQEYKKVIFQNGNFKTIPDVAVDSNYPYKDKRIVLFGDSISVNEASSAYEAKMKLKTKCDNIIRVGQGGQSYAGVLANYGSQINAQNPDLVIMHVTNDHRNNETIGDLNSPISAGTMVGGLRKILTDIIAYNKNVKIIICTPLTAGGGGALPASDSANSIGKFMVDYAEAMIRVARVYGCSIVDLSSECGFRPRVEESETDRVYTNDGVHPISVGYEVMTSIISKKVNSL